jgi:hypothetical protein
LLIDVVKKGKILAKISYENGPLFIIGIATTSMMANQNILDEQQESRNTVDNTARNETPDVLDVNRSRNDSEDSIEQCAAGGMCGVNGVLCNSGNVLESIFPYLSNKCNDSGGVDSPRDVRNIVSGGNGTATLSPLSKPIRRGRFLVWPAVVDCGTPLTACGPVAITSSSSSSAE